MVSQASRRCHEGLCRTCSGSRLDFRPVSNALLEPSARKSESALVLECNEPCSVVVVQTLTASRSETCCRDFLVFIEHRMQAAFGLSKYVAVFSIPFMLPWTAPPASGEQPRWSVRRSLKRYERSSPRYER